MALLLSLSNSLCKMLNWPLERITDAEGAHPGVQSISTNAHRMSWQGQVIHLSGKQWYPYDDGSWLVVFMEAHSRYCMLNHYPMKPNREQVLADFYQYWKLHLVGWLRARGVMSTDEDGIWVLDNIEHFFEQSQVTYFRNLDPSIGAHIADLSAYLHEYFDNYRPPGFEHDTAWALSIYINQRPRRVKGQRRKQDQFYPALRFTEDALYRFASGLSTERYPNVNAGDFPCPYPEAPALRVLE
ncbi:amino acid adenylation [Shewanella sp. NIFS-20-20]|nr:amino acid adenylation [Shewanella sp. NIFS-20-20]